MTSVFKYRGGDWATVKRDLRSMANGEVYFAPFASLNDPFEATIVLDGRLFDFVGLLFGLFKGKKVRNEFKELNQVVKGEVSDLLKHFVKNIGIYSLSRTVKDEVMWAHYANSHKGFCMEFDLDKLRTNQLETGFWLDVAYLSQPPKVSFVEMVDRKILNSSSRIGLGAGEGSISYLMKLLSSKSMRWSYEQEVRICMLGVGAFRHDLDALKSIYFGVRAERRLIRLVMRLMRGRGLKYYQMKMLDDSYGLNAELIDDRPKKSEF